MNTEFKKCEHKNCSNFFSITSNRQKFKRFCSRVCKERNCDLTSDQRRTTSRKNARKRWHSDPAIKQRSNELKSIRYHAMSDVKKKKVNKNRNQKYKAYRLQRHYDRMENDTHYMLRQKISDRIRKALKNGYGEKSKSCKTYIGCSIPELRKHMESQFVDGMIWDNYGDWHIDHIKPCSSYDLSKEEDQIECFNYTNLQPLWAEDNLKKGSSLNFSRDKNVD